MKDGMRILKFVVLMISLWSSVATSLFAQHTVVPLYAGVAPGSEGKTAAEAVRLSPEGEHIYSSIHKPSITVYLPTEGTATGVGILVIPGGGHREIWADHEGFRVAEWLSQHGVAAFVLKYRLAREAGSTYTVEGTELDDARKAMRLIRQHGSEWSVDPERLGVIGFSAGGELAALVATRPEAGDTKTKYAVSQESSAADFQALIYPSIPKEMSLSKATPPAFLACGANDGPGVSEGLAELYLRVKRAGAAAELHVYSGAGHGFGIRNTNPPNVSAWPDEFYAWLRSSGFIRK